MSAIATPPASKPPLETPAEKLQRLIAERGDTKTATLLRLRENCQRLQLSDAEYEDFLRTVPTTRRAEESP